MKGMKFEDAASKISYFFVGVSVPDESINASLGVLGLYTKASKCFIYVKDGKDVKNRFTWSRNGKRFVLKDLCNNRNSELCSVIHSGRVLTSDDASELKQLKEKSAFLAVPFLILGRASGFIGLVRKKKGWSSSEIKLVKMTADMLGNAISKEIYEKKLLLHNKRLAKSRKRLSRFNDQLGEEVRRRTKELELAYERLKKVDSMKDNFLSNISHELRTPLTSLKSYNQLLASGIFGKVNIKQKEALDIILDCTNHLIELVNSILDVSRYEAGKAELDLSRNDLSKLIRSVVKEFKPTLDKTGSGVQLKSLVKKELLVDPERMKDVFRNIINNSIKYRKEDLFISIVLKSVSHKGKRYQSISFKDNGQGISSENLDHIFDKFYQVKQGVNKTEGTGLGLSIVKHIIDMHKGKIDVKSKEGEWTEFTVMIPEN